MSGGAVSSGLPALEVTGGVFEFPASVVFGHAGDRIDTINAPMLAILGRET